MIVPTTPLQAKWTVALALIMLLAASPGNTISSTQPDGVQSDFALYGSDELGREYHPLDPITLADMGTAEPLAFGHDYQQMAASADGSTFVTINPTQGPLKDWIVVHDGVNGPERLTIDVEEAVYHPRLSHDGSRLVVEPTVICGPSGCGERLWYSYDTGTGELVSVTRAELNDYVWPDMMTPQGDRLYVPFHERSNTPTSGSEPGPWPLQIAAFDLSSGQEIGTTTVPDVFAGSWRDDSTYQVYIGQMERPAIALSPDGTTIAVVDAPMETLTLIDAASLEVVETHAIVEAESGLDRALQWLGIMPRSAQAKISEGRTLSASFSADGQHLYVFGQEIEAGEGDTVEEVSDVTGHGFGLLKIDVGNGEITGETMANQELAHVMPSLDGEWVYVLRSEEPWWDNDARATGYVLHRLDAETLEPLAEREFGSWPNIHLMPTGSG